MMKYLFFDTETTGLSIHHGHRPFLYIWSTDGLQIHCSKDKEDIRPYLEDEEYIKVAHNAKFDILMMHSVGISVKGKVYDTMIMSQLVDENTPNSLDASAKQHLRTILKSDKIKEYFKEQKTLKKDQCYADVPDDIIVPYARKDVEVTARLFYELKTKLEDEALWQLFESECELIKVLVDMELKGMKIDVPYFSTEIAHIKPEIDNLEKEIYRLAGKEFNIRSPKQLAEVISSFGIELKKTQKGNPKTDVEELKQMNHPLPKAILKYREAYKFYKTYFIGLLDSHVAGVIHCKLNQCGTVTGRFSSSNPNLQNLHKEDTRVRRGFICRENYTNFYIDYEQMEYRVFAAYANDPYLISQISAGLDFHQIIADELDIPRKNAKTLNFGLIYGMGTHSLAKQLGIRIYQAERYKQKYFDRFENVFPFLNRVHQTISERGFVFNMFNRRRRMNKSEAYKAVNALIQGCCADIVKKTMVKVYNYLKPYRSNLILQVHDELVIEVHKEEIFVVPHIKDIMENWGHLVKVPLTVDVNYTETNWADKKEWGK